MKKLISGPGGTNGLGYEKGIPHIASLGLGALEVELTHGINISNETAKKIGALAKEHGISLSVHAPYYINLASIDKEKVIASKKRILDACERAHFLGAKNVVFHAGFYMGRDKLEVFDVIASEIKELLATIKKNKYDIVLAPELTGKPTQFGDLDELIALSEITGCFFTIDFAHMLARYGKLDYDWALKKLKRFKTLHIHFSGIEYTAKGERRHLITQQKDIEKLIAALQKYGFSAVIINESPDPISDAVKTKKIIEQS
ncbi:TIM barrel protein [Candidatus Woesearchaeota archaeon]|nr:TIM barrel protein [Candidatus Woesearchaeota archaeon]